MSAPTIRRVNTIISAASTATDPQLRAVYAATARAELATLKAMASAAEIMLDAIEREVAREARQ